MKCLVAVKSIPQQSPIAKIGQDKWVIDPFSEVAIERALQLQEAGLLSEVVAISVGEQEAALRSALALGVNRAVRIAAAGDDGHNVARLLADYIQQQPFELLLLGKQSADTDNHQLPQRLAALLGWPQFSGVDQLLIDQGHIIASGLTLGGRGQYVAAAPVVVSADLRLAAPRFASLPTLMKARRAPIEVLEVATAASSLTCLQQQATVIQRQGTQLTELSQLAALLQQGGRS
ncbi:electron transfer flavoprotein subunit beta/FixA family protein [Ferrimonas senticii]|uniref:electron transfer flavoprotein subunit beta/FixA family protein n=1 Tax=Ferrimonas senticii TaxID=394566 RepID=UPI0004009084|nr:hypothetical protein [Ferrimonas senticii]